MLRARSAFVRFLASYGRPTRVSCLLASFVLPSLAQAQTVNWPNEFDRCYALDWIYEEASSLRIASFPQTSTLTWYCQAKPQSALSFSYRQYQSYQDEWLDAVDFSVLRCERGETEACTYRCALAPRVCSPHFWP